jgi:hypothetical protein
VQKNKASSYTNIHKHIQHDSDDLTSQREMRECLFSSDRKTDSPHRTRFLTISEKKKSKKLHT